MTDHLIKAKPRNFFAEWSERSNETPEPKTTIKDALKEVSNAVFLKPGKPESHRDHW